MTCNHYYVIEQMLPEIAQKHCRQCGYTKFVASLYCQPGTSQLVHDLNTGKVKIIDVIIQNSTKNDVGGMVENKDIIPVKPAFMADRKGYYEKNKTRIIHDLGDIGSTATTLKWDMSSAMLSILKRRWSLTSRVYAKRGIVIGK